MFGNTQQNLDRVQWFGGEGTTLEFRDEISKKIENYYLVLKIFGTFLTFMMTCSLVGFGYSFFKGEWMAGYDGAFRIVGFISAGISLMINVGLWIGAFKLMKISDKTTTRISRGEFQYHIGQVTDKRTGRKQGSYISVDDVECHSLGSAEYAEARLGACYVIIRMNDGLLFAAKYDTQGEAVGFF